MFKENAYQVLEGDSREHDRSSIIRDLRKRDRSRDSRERDRSRDSKERDRSSIIRDSREHDRSSIIRDLRKRDIGRSLIIRDSKSPKGYDSDQSRHNRTESPLEPEAGYYRYAQNVLENMDEEQYKNFHDEVVQILSGLDDTLQLDHTKK
ncbi:uncharacterized protein OCT59_020838 [Rhizophagus irregularis]|uniref:uncharacterized protein n=1 Tax=Rhizophagus irregularis TaxID=588596 RepID=UPI00332A1ED7|nr:hypothetical protein OCT59_020838 [Rhizophagus irregularis]